MSEPQVRRLVGGQVIRSGNHGGYVITREAVEGMREQLNEKPVPVNIEHDPTQLPVGRVMGGRLVELADGEVALETEMELFEGSVEASLHATSEIEGVLRILPEIRPCEGPLALQIDERSYSAEDLDALVNVASRVGRASAAADALRFSSLPDALLVFALGSGASATWWFSKGFFTKLGEGAGGELGTEIGRDLVTAYRAFKAKVREAISRRTPADRPPLTMLTLQIDRPGAGIVEVEGSTRSEGAALDDFLDAGEELLAIARAYVDIAAAPSRVAKLHFAYEDDVWRLRYGLDDDALPVMIVVLSDERYQELLDEAKRDDSADAH
jgi:hypothetical protein